jgi:hypothetical protein
MGGITRDDVITVGTVQVSAGGWMPILQISKPIATPHFYPAQAYVGKIPIHI